MQRGKKRIQPEEPKVILKPILGLTPPQYIGVIYGLGFAVLLFFLLVFPGLYQRGAKVTIYTVPSGASLIIDTIRVGASPATIFLTEGEHTLEIRKPGFAQHTQVLPIRGRILGSLFFPKKIHLSFPLEIVSAEELLMQTYREFASWVLSGKPTAMHPFPPLLQNLARDLTQGKGARPSSERIHTFLLQSIPQINSAGVLHDFIGALSTFQAEGTVLTHRSLIRSLDFFASLIEEHPYSILWLASVLPPTVSATFRNSPVVAKYTTEMVKGLKARSAPPDRTGLEARKILIGGKEFAFVPGGSFNLGWASLDTQVALPYYTTVPSFYLRTTEVTEEEFARFIRESPAWAPQARETLIKQGLVDEGYLSSWKDSLVPPNPSYPVREISFFAAKAYSAWLETKYPQFAFGIPTEQEWEWAASLNLTGREQAYPNELRPAHQGQAGTLGLRFMLGNVWEWMDTWFAPSQSFFPGIPLTQGVEKVVKGGAYLNPAPTITVSTRGSQPPYWCTPFLGFRVKAVPRWNR